MRNLSVSNSFVRSTNNWDLLFATILWNLWLSHNAKVFGSPCMEEGSIISRSVHLVQLMEQAHVNQPVPKSRDVEIARRPSHWVPPPPSWVKINTDRAWRAVANYFRCGGVAWNSNGL
ncbi:hypothetical protein V6N13_005901 [Hibiscus sabdariffa]